MKGFRLIKTDDIHKATHWLAKGNDDNDVTPYQIYRLYRDQCEEEYFIMDDKGIMSMIYMCHEGDFVVWVDSERYYETIEFYK